jgi:hypothetical protein
VIFVASILVIFVAKVVTESSVLDSETPGLEGSATKGTKATTVQPLRHEGHEANVSIVVIS